MTSLWRENPPIIQTDEFRNGSHYDEVIVGAGITGLTAALLFARRGRRVAVMEARSVGAVATGNTTAKISQLQGAQFSKIKSHNYQAVLQAYADGGRAAFDWLMEFMAAAHVAVERRDAYSYAATQAGSRAVDREFELARSVGLPVRKVVDAGLPFPTYSAVVLADQAQIDPMELLAALASEVRSLGGVIIEGARVSGVRAATEPARVATSLGEVFAEHVILATGTPMLDRGLYFAKVVAQRSYAQSFDLPEGRLPDGMFLNVESPTRSIRTWRGQLLTGGNGHPVGREASPRGRANDLTRWTETNWPGATLTHSWSAQDYSPMHHVPFVGWFPRGFHRIYLATGYDKWGMTNGVAAALTLVEDILGENTAWQRALHARFTTPQVIGRGIGENAAVGLWYAKGYVRGLLRRLPDAAPPEGHGSVGRSHLLPSAVSTVDGTTCRLSGICTHLGAVVTWNDEELSWDCPAHGSRFAADGTLLEGPATRNLRRV